MCLMLEEIIINHSDVGGVREFSAIIFELSLTGLVIRETVLFFD